ncbi:uncharacterized protein LOC112453465 [Temnothorax curvispinosus]|uniref:Uncharacterized protein LOC112453465 n=1 Tax=Temnothorax curvispinosus TaxID=300111 RepID=A0A6J1PKX0_9HYME|nr:uncharacterized protein LOC112453465 [Temnothorax curvispinosus]
MELPSMTKENCIELRQIADGDTKHLHALQALRRPTAHWDDLLVHILSAKIDSLSLREWQSSFTGTEVPSLKQFFDFITHRCQMLEATNKSNAANSKATDAQSSSKRQSSHVSTVKTKCIYCQGEHSIYYCKDFLALSIPRRISEVRSRHICFNCLRTTTHNASNCTSGCCKVCRAKHNTLLHAPSKSTELADGAKSGDESKSNSAPAVLVTHASRPIDGSHIILSTAVV